VWIVWKKLRRHIGVIISVGYIIFTRCVCIVCVCVCVCLCVFVCVVIALFAFDSVAVV
jgi:hypothetical protein